MTGCLEPIFQSLEGYRRIYLDLPGMGKTPVSQNIKNADDMLAVVEKFVAAVIGDEKFLLVGESYGGYLSLGLLHLQAKIEGLFLICPCIIADIQQRELPEKEIMKHDKDLALIKDDKDYENFMDAAVIATKETFLRYKQEISPGILMADKPFLAKYRKEGYSFSFADKISSIKSDRPACIVLGRQDDSVGYMDALKLISNFTRATFVVADSSGHNLQIEREGLLTASFIDWLERISAE